MSTLSQNNSAISKIKTLINSQHQHERQWWTGRLNLISKQKGRDVGRKKADDLLKSLGAGSANQSFPRGGDAISDSEKKELDVYDAKVHKALSEMSKAMDGELRGLGVPFFAIRHEFVDVNVETRGEDSTSTLSRKQLVDLQKQMLQLLQDLFAD